MQEVGVHTIVPAAVLEATPLQNAVALLSLSVVAAAASNGGLKLPSSATRLAVTVDGTESEEQIALLKVRLRLRKTCCKQQASCLTTCVRAVSQENH